MDISAVKADGDANDDWDLTRRLLPHGRRSSASGGRPPLVTKPTYQGSGSVGLKAAESLTVERQQLEDWATRLPIGVVTGRPEVTPRLSLERFDLTELMSVVVTRTTLAQT